MPAGGDMPPTQERYPLSLPVLGLLLTICFPFVFAILSGSGFIGLPDEDLPLVGDSDVYVTSWQFWWVGHAVGQGSSPLRTDLRFYPETTTLMTDNVGWTDAVLMLPLSLWLPGSELPLLYNGALLLGSLLTALAAWMLGRAWGLDRFTGLLFCLLVVWLPPRVAHLLQHYPIANISYLLFSMAFLRRYLTDGRLSRCAVSGAMALMAGLESAYYLPFLLAGAVATLLFSRVAPRRLMAPALIVLGAAVSGAVLFYVLGAGDISSVEVGWREAVYWSAEPQSVLLPSPFGLAGRLLGMPARLSWMPNIFEGVVTPGLSVLVLFLLFVRRRRGLALAACAALLFLLAMGPELRLLGRPTGIPLPYRLLQLLPLMSGARAPARFALMGGCVVGLGAMMQLRSLPSAWRFPVAALVVLEIAVPNLPVIDSTVPDAYAEGEGGGPVLEVPVSLHNRRYYRFQTIDHRPRFVLHIARLPFDTLPVRFLPFGFAADVPVTVDDIGRTGATTVLYNRWLVEEGRRAGLDSAFALIGAGEPADAPVWVWSAP